MSCQNKPIQISPLPAAMNLAGADGTLTRAEARLVVNMLNGRRVFGLRKFGWDDPSGAFLNQDLHDQMLGAVRNQIPRTP